MDDASFAASLPAPQLQETPALLRLLLHFLVLSMFGCVCQCYARGTCWEPFYILCKPFHWSNPWKYTVCVEQRENDVKSSVKVPIQG